MEEENVEMKELLPFLVNALFTLNDFRKEKKKVEISWNSMEIH